MKSMWAFVLCVFVFCLPACGQAPQRVTVVTYNIHRGVGEDGRLDLKRTAEVIRRLKPDVVALQEVDNGTRRSDGVDQAKVLGELTGMHARFGAALPNFDGGQYGEAILSRWPITKTMVHPLPADRGYETRAALAVRIEPTDGEPFWFVGTHLDHTSPDTQRRKQVEALNEKLIGHDMGPTILAGDFNAEPGDAPMRMLFEHWRDAMAGQSSQQAGTWPADQPRVRIDYVLCRPAAAWRVVIAEVIEEKAASDHRPVRVVLDRVSD